MDTTPDRPTGKRERNKQDKLNRIVAAAAGLFDELGFESVTAQLVAERAEIAKGTLFLYARTMGELLLLVQNAHYAEAVARGRAEASAVPDRPEAVRAMLRAIVAYNRRRIDTGRRYLQEVLFGDPDQPHRVQALAIVAEADAVIAGILGRGGRLSESEAERRARSISQILFANLGLSENLRLDDEQLVDLVASQCAPLLD
ncbi:TetR/AcrR family transcriptional regulator [Rathayibacter sp. VKM Ac-2760]|uniref:TetR/AcrR family transcriptional regulator n=1 Tax=Rathayibacter sp. VKM Ac-2760 TaxID=2609253 RepID=UPI001317E6D5|nr:TetR/AcrR family transcriptional regulator [Rathayibacter sp. VKM Ac-2760]QHC61085.1 TetR family transcriptional regulator [Rathayibacter sp. VKM Ac-2760]